VKKILWIFVIIISLIAASFFLYFYCYKNKLDSLQSIAINSEQTIPQCSARNLDKNIVLIVSKYCPHCKKATDIIKTIVKNHSLKNKYQRIDITEPQGQMFLTKSKINIFYTPTLIANCKSYIGIKSKKVYKDIFSQED